MWETIFATANILAMLMWLALAFLPRWPALLSAILYLGVGLLCLAYTVGIVAFVAGAFDTGGLGGGLDFGSIEGVRAAFRSDAGLTIGWIHYLAFDLFVGLWIARDADAKNFSRWIQIPILFATFVAGPVGLLLWLAIRERRARALGRWK